MTMTTSGNIPPDLKIVIVSASQAVTSRSRLAARYAQAWLAGQQIGVDFIDLQDYRVLSYPHSEADPEVSALIERFKAADGWVLAGPVYNWGASGVLVNFCSVC